MTLDSDREKRIAPRHLADVRCWVGDGGVERYARVGDINEYGMRIETVAPPEVGATVTVRFKLPPLGSPVEAHAEVRWRANGEDTRSGAMGVQFQRILGRETIQAYSRRLENDGAIDEA